MHCIGYKVISIADHSQPGFNIESTIPLPDRRRRKNPKRERLFLRLTSRQLELLRQYIDYRGFDSEAAGIRAMIDGLEDWFVRQEAKHTPATSIAPIAAEPDSGPPQVTDVTPSDVVTSVGDFGGRLAVRLPESRHDGNE